ncbi:PVC-type heme-binding CxxCH protein [Lignipirellula cremea]|uniref:Cytochrome c n=1 Tax=Lignipirellula cremea TaxID=2528010 RepID=A0A518DU70_9BACT|nr:PVC-type heme-binding CxxCH protein [Lignipirellula cremea]QDU95379.1 Cytochrome c [Lignipirellula cremea]
MLRNRCTLVPTLAVRALAARLPHCLLLVLLLLVSPIDAQEILPDGTADALKSMAALQKPDGLEMELFAAEPQLAGPVAFCLDEQGRVYVAEEYRFNRGTEENRTRAFFLEDDLQLQTVEDRLAMYKKHAHEFDGGMEWFSRVADQVRIVEDRDQDGRADFSRIFAGPFNEPLDGLAAGVIARDGDVYLTCIPHLWKLRDTNGDGKADVKESLQRGFGVNCAFLGHDLHGLVWGPDGRLYFSVGDRGFNLTTKEGKHLVGPRRGGVFRCDPDGSNLELVHVGLRNPQELAFDEFGNLFAADNNCDKGDLSRLVYVVDGGDSGWNMAYQTIEDPYLTGPWHAEKMWHVNAVGQPAWILPPVGSLGSGPSGFVYYPGVGLDRRYDGHFFLCNYTGDGGIESFAVKPHGASFRITDDHSFLKPVRATDVDFGYDGKMYVLDFVNLDWTGKSLGGRIYTLFDKAFVASDEARQVRQRFAEGFTGLTAEELFALFDHSDMRMRLRSQYEAAGREGMVESLRALATAADNPARTRRHAVWALWQIGRRDPQAIVALRELTGHADADTREQAIKALGDLRDVDSLPIFTASLSDDLLRVRFQAALAIGRLGPTAGATDSKQIQGAPEAIKAVVRMLEENHNADPYLRHAGVMALYALSDDAALLRLSGSSHAAVRLAAVLVARRRPEVDLAPFLQDEDLDIVTEAARAINGLERVAAEPALADTAERLLRAPAPEALVRRVIHANFRLGRAQTLLGLAVGSHLAPAMQQEALACLAAWSTGAKRDRVNGNWRPLAPHEIDGLKRRLQDGGAEKLLAGAQGDVMATAIGLLTQYEIDVDDAMIAAWAADDKRPAATRLECLGLLAQRKSKHTGETIDCFLHADEPRLRAAGRRQLAQGDPKAALKEIQAALSNPAAATLELQSDVAVLAGLKQPAADAVLTELLSQFVAPQTERRPELDGLELDLVTAAGERKESAELAKLLSRYREQTEKAALSNPLAAWRAALYGGDAERGEQLFRAHRKAQCMRCHKVHGDGGTAGPDLSELAKRATREHLLESIVEPNAKIAKGFGSATVITDRGKVIGGFLREETPEAIVLETPQGEQVRIPVEEIDERIQGRSLMPDVRTLLELHEIRDLVEFLSQQK